MFSLSRFFFIYTHFSSSITSSQRLSQSSCQKQPNFLSISFDHKSCFVIFILLMSLENFFCCLLSIFTARSKAPTGQRSYFFAMSLSPNTIQACCMWSISMCRPNEMNIFFTYWVFLYNIIYTELGFFFWIKICEKIILFGLLNLNYFSLPFPFFLAFLLSFLLSFKYLSASYYMLGTNNEYSILCTMTLNKFLNF